MSDFERIKESIFAIESEVNGCIDDLQSARVAIRDIMPFLDDGGVKTELEGVDKLIVSVTHRLEDI